MKDVKLVMTNDDHGLHETEYMKVGDDRLVMCRGCFGIYVAGIEKGPYSENGNLTEVVPIPDERKTEVRNRIWEKYGAAENVSFENYGYI